MAQEEKWRTSTRGDLETNSSITSAFCLLLVPGVETVMWEVVGRTGDENDDSVEGEGVLILAVVEQVEVEAADVLDVVHG